MLFKKIICSRPPDKLGDIIIEIDMCEFGRLQRKAVQAWPLCTAGNRKPQQWAGLGACGAGGVRSDRFTPERWDRFPGRLIGCFQRERNINLGGEKEWHLRQ